MAKTLKVLPHDKERKNKLINIIFSSLIIINIVVGLLAIIDEVFGIFLFQSLSSLCNIKHSLLGCLCFNFYFYGYMFWGLSLAGLSIMLNEITDTTIHSLFTIGVLFSIIFWWGVLYLLKRMTLFFMVYKKYRKSTKKEIK